MLYTVLLFLFPFSSLAKIIGIILEGFPITFDFEYELNLDLLPYYYNRIYIPCTPRESRN